MADEALHLIVRHEDGLGVYSPQVPELLAVYRDEESVMRALPGALSFAGVDPTRLATAIRHDEVVRADGDFLVRMADDAVRAARADVADRLYAAMTVAGQHLDMLDQPASRGGSVLFVCAVTTDTIGWVHDQLDPRGEVAAVAVSVAQDAVWTACFGRNIDEAGWQSLADWGWSRDTTISEVMRSPLLTRRPRSDRASSQGRARVLVGA